MANSLANLGTRDQTHTNDVDIVGSARSTSTPTIGAWEYSSGASPATGDSSGTFTFSGSAAGQVAVVGSSTNSFALSGSAAGLAYVDGASTTTFTLSGSATGTSALEPRYGRPTADISDGAWLPSTPATDLFAMLDELVADDLDYIYTSSATTAILKCTELDTSGMTTAVLRAQVPTGFTASGALTVSLYQGNSPGTEVCKVEQTDPAAGLYEHTLTAGEKAAITNGSDLYFRVTAA